MTTLLDRNIGLALSGGGVRAAAFHAGVLRRLAELGALERIRHVSSVSGGSLLVGLMLRSTDYQWPTSREYLEESFPYIRRTLTTVSLIGHAWRALLLRPRNWRHVLSRANVVAASIAECWDIRACLGDLPQTPIWSINGTTGENGRRFSFRGMRAGDGAIGYADAKRYALADAMAISAAYPVGIGPLRFAAAQYTWQRRERDGPGNAAIGMPFRSLHLYDGGLYDNLGLEPLWNMGSRRIRRSAGGIDCIVVSDATALLEAQKVPGPFSLRRAGRLMDIVSAQTRALRVRAFVNALRSGETSGLYLPIRAVAGDTGTHPESPPADDLWDDGTDWSVPLTPAQVTAVAGFRTTLARMHPVSFDLIARHGYETLQWREPRLRSANG
jgi:NTE family protein